MTSNKSTKKEKVAKLIVPTLNSRFPTIDRFNDIIDPIINTEKVEVKIGPPEPILPPYLTEMEVEGNPFSSIKVSKLKDLKQEENIRKAFDIGKKLDYPVRESVNRDTRINYNANYKTKMFKYEIDMKEIKDKMEEPEELPKVFKSSKFISNYDFIVDKRKICLLDLAINIKEEQFAKLEKIVEEEERYIKEESERLQKEHDNHDQYLKQICQKTSDAIKLAEKETAKKNRIAEKVKRARYNMAHLNAECVKLEEEYLRLKTYKEFLKNCHRQQEKKNALERSSLMNELKLDAILKDIDFELDEYDKYSEESEFEYKKYKAESESNSNKNNALNINNQLLFNKPTFSISIEDLEKLKMYIISGFSDDNNEDEIRNILSNNQNVNNSNQIDNEVGKVIDETDLNDDQVYFEDPQDLVNILSELEANNLSLIENVQEQEEMCDHMRNRISNIKSDMNKQISLIDKHINKEHKKIAELEESINCIKETEQFLQTFNDLERYKKIFYFGDLDVKTPDEMMDYLHEKITELYHSVFEKVDSTKSNTVEMLKRIESLVDSLYIELQSHERQEILKAKKIVDERKREAARLRQKELCKEAELLKIQKAMEKAKMPPRYYRGRKLMYRSEPPKPIVKEIEIDWDEVRQQEENQYFFT